MPTLMITLTFTCMHALTLAPARPPAHVHVGCETGRIALYLLKLLQPLPDLSPDFIARGVQLVAFWARARPEKLDRCNLTTQQRAHLAS